MGAVLILIVLGTTIWVFIDAGKLGLDRTWAVGTFLLWILFFPWYLVVRSRKKSQVTIAPPASTTPNWYPDPWMQADLRYWDGSSWTSHTTEQGGT